VSLPGVATVLVLRSGAHCLLAKPERALCVLRRQITARCSPRWAPRTPAACTATCVCCHRHAAPVASDAETARCNLGRASAVQENLESMLLGSCEARWFQDGVGLYLNLIPSPNLSPKRCPVQVVPEALRSRVYAFDRCAPRASPHARRSCMPRVATLFCAQPHACPAVTAG